MLQCRSSDMISFLLLTVDARKKMPTVRNADYIMQNWNNIYSFFYEFSQLPFIQQIIIKELATSVNSVIEQSRPIYFNIFNM